MLPLHRWLVGTVGVLMSTGALAQAAATPPTVDESKLPEWVKRQARSPYKVIIESSAAKARTPVAGPGSAAASVPKEDSAARLAKKATPAAATAPVAAVPTPPAEKADAPATGGAAPSVAPMATPEAVTPGNELRAAAAAPPITANPANLPDTSPLTSIPADPATLQLATATATSSATAAAAKPAIAAATLPAPELSPLTLLNRVEPEFPSDLVNDRLNQANVVVSFTVKADGEVVNASVASSSDPRLNRSVLRAVRAWRYAPIDAPREHSVRFAFTTS